MRQSRRARNSFRLALLSALSVGCGVVLGGCGGGSGASCGGTEPCGGDVVGTWSIASDCVSAAGANAEFQASSYYFCPAATASVTGITHTGTIVFNADLSYTIDSVVQSSSFRVTLPSSCLNGAQCSDLTQAFASDSTIQSATCSGGSSCVCTIVAAPQAVSDAGTYTTAGTTLDVQSTTSGADAVPYCVQGDKFHLLTLNTTMNMGLMGQMTVEEDVVAIRQ
jgi:hypothetical protein